MRVGEGIQGLPPVCPAYEAHIQRKVGMTPNANATSRTDARSAPLAAFLMRAVAQPIGRFFFGWGLRIDKEYLEHSR